MKGDGIGAYLGYNILLFKNNLLMLYHQWRKYHIALAIWCSGNSDIDHISKGVHNTLEREIRANIRPHSV
jgi:hypothetical protein